MGVFKSTNLLNIYCSLEYTYYVFYMHAGIPICIYLYTFYVKSIIFMQGSVVKARFS